MSAALAPTGPAGGTAPSPHARKWHDAVVRVIVAEEFSLLRRRLEVVLGDQPDLEVMAEAADADQLHALARELVPDVVVVGASLPPHDGVPAVAALRELVPTVEVVAIRPEHDDDGLRAVRAGVTAFLPARTAAELAPAVVRQAARRRPVLAPALAAAVVADFDRLGRPGGSVPAAVDPPVLAPAERAALLEVAGGAPPAGAPDDLDAARRAALVRNALERLARHTRLEAVLHLAAPTPPA